MLVDKHLSKFHGHDRRSVRFVFLTITSVIYRFTMQVDVNRGFSLHLQPPEVQPVGIYKQHEPLQQDIEFYPIHASP